MTSPSKKALKSYSFEGEGVNREEDWLELTLGFGSACSKVRMHGSHSSSSSSFQSETSKQVVQGKQPAFELKLGLEMGFGNKDLSDNQDVDIEVPSQNHHYQPSPLFSSLCSNGLPKNPVSNSNVSHHFAKRPHPGLWFKLRSIINRNGEVLPQIPKAYIRVKDKSVTVLMVKTYLVRKLSLSNETEVQISCMGQNLLHSQTMKHVRDAIWLPKLVEFLNSNQNLVGNSDGTTLHHLMSLEYERCYLFHGELQD